MTLQPAVYFAQRFQFAVRNDARFGQCRVLHGHAVTFGQNETIAAFPFRVIRIVAQEAAEVECGDNLDGGQGAARVSARRFCEHLDNVPADGGRAAAQRGQIAIRFLSCLYCLSHCLLQLY
jgi:hypothetical protein